MSDQPQPLAAWAPLSLPERFDREFNADQLVAVEAIERAVVAGVSSSRGLRDGEGKKTIAVAAALWAMLERRLADVLLIVPHQARAAFIAEQIHDELFGNGYLSALYPTPVAWYRENGAPLGARRAPRAVESYGRRSAVHVCAVDELAGRFDVEQRFDLLVGVDVERSHLDTPEERRERWRALRAFMRDDRGPLVELHA